MGQYTGVGIYEDQRLKKIDCPVSLNVKYSKEQKTLFYDYAQMCMSELSYPSHRPSNDSSFALKVDENNLLRIIMNNGELSRPIGIKQHGRFSFTLSWKMLATVQWIPQQLSLQARTNHCVFLEDEVVPLHRTVNYQIDFSEDLSNPVFFERTAVVDLLPFLMTKKCGDISAGSKQKYEVKTHLKVSIL